MAVSMILAVLLSCVEYSEGTAGKYPTNPFIGTGKQSVLQSRLLEAIDTLNTVGGEGFGIGSTPPGAQYPFGLVRLSPDTSTLGNVALDDWHFGGYHYGQSAWTVSADSNLPC